MIGTILWQLLLILMTGTDLHLDQGKNFFHGLPFNVKSQHQCVL
jgi:hypothetical protein